MNPTSNQSKSTSHVTAFFILNCQEHVFRKVREIHMYGAGLNQDLVLEIQNKTCSSMWRLLGYIACGVHLCKHIHVFRNGKTQFPSSCKPCHPGLGTSMHCAKGTLAELSKTVVQGGRFEPRHFLLGALNCNAQQSSVLRVCLSDFMVSGRSFPYTFPIPVF